jgi:hypothetical protein
MSISVLISGAHNVAVNVYDDLTTNNPVIAAGAAGGLGGIGVTEWSLDGKPHKPGWVAPKTKVPGMEISGLLGDARFVMRIPDQWNNKLVVCAAGGFASERSMDTNLSDYVLTKLDAGKASFAYACTDKGTRGELMPAPDGVVYPEKRENTALLHDEDDLAKWHRVTQQLTVAAKNLLCRLKGLQPVRTYISGGSNGGYVARYAIEHDGDLYDGALDWKGVLWTPDINNISVKAEQIRCWSILKNPDASLEEKVRARKKYALPPESDFLMEHYDKIKKLPPDSLRMKFDPTYKHRDWWEYNQHPEDYDHYFWEERPQEVKDAVAKISLTGNIQKPIISVAGTWDVQIHPLHHAVGYRNLIERSGKAGMHRLYLIDQATHLDGLAGHPQVDPNHRMQAVLPYYHQAFDLLIDWVEHNNPPPPSKTVGMPVSRDKAISLLTGEEVDKY